MKYMLVTFGGNQEARVKVQTVFMSSGNNVAFSRDAGAKTYVQHRMQEQSRDLFAWLEEGAHFYVCGDEKAMARDVHETLIQIVEGESGRSREAAEDYVRNLAAEHRYQRDVY